MLWARLWDTAFTSSINPFISGMHHWECVAPNVDIPQSPEWTILSHDDCIIQREVTGFQVLLDSLHPCSTRAS